MLVHNSQTVLVETFPPEKLSHAHAQPTDRTCGDTPPPKSKTTRDPRLYTCCCYPALPMIGPQAANKLCLASPLQAEATALDIRHPPPKPGLLRCWFQPP
jgi:hypothetical protein